MKPGTLIATVVAAAALALAACADEPTAGTSAPAPVRPLAEVRTTPRPASAVAATCGPFETETLADVLEAEEGHVYPDPGDAPAVRLAGLVTSLHACQADRLDVRLYLRDGVADPVRDELLARLRELPEVRSFRYVSAEEALEDLREHVDPEVLDELPANPLPSSVVVAPRDVDAVEAITAALEDHPALDPADPLSYGIDLVDAELLRALTLFEFDGEASAQAWVDRSRLVARAATPTAPEAAVPEGAICEAAEDVAGAARCVLRRGPIVLLSEASPRGRAEFAAEQGLIFLDEWVSHP